MEGAKTKYILVALVVIIIVSASIGFYLIKDAGVEGITAMDAKIFADDVATNWDENVSLLSVRKAGHGTGGLFEAWFFIYMDSNIVNSSTNCVEIKIYSNGSHSIRYNASQGSDFSLGSGWIIDSNDAYEIASNNEEINSFLNHNPYCDSFALRNESGILLWDIEWAYDAGFDNPKWAEIYIDANTGEVLYVEVDN